MPSLVVEGGCANDQTLGFIRGRPATLGLHRSVSHTHFNGINWFSSPMIRLRLHQATRSWQTWNVRRAHYTVLAIETSCDDTSVAILEYAGCSAKTLFHQTVTAQSDAHAGIHPLVALQSHRTHLAPLLRKAVISQEANSVDATLQHHAPRWKPDVIAATRGPGMRNNLSVGLDAAKALAAVWDVPLVGVHHMQAHALTPRLVTALGKGDPYPASRVELSRNSTRPAFPFLTVLVSGGHTMLLSSTSLTGHATLAETQDIAVGDCLDKAARTILPPSCLRSPYGAALERFAFRDAVETSGRSRIDPDEIIAASHYSYDPPARRQDEMTRRPTKWAWSIAPPLADSKAGEKSPNRMVYSFAGLLSIVERYMMHEIDTHGSLTTRKRDPEHITLAERRDMAREVQRIAFEHIASRIMLYLSASKWTGDTVVVSGGVASNKFLRHVLRSILDIRGYGYVKLEFPPVELCTDNALMIAWAAVEMVEAGHTNDFSILPLRKWSMDPDALDGGILGVGGYTMDDGAALVTNG